METLRKEFSNPPLTNRGAPFWSWNDRLQVDELARQVRDMKAHGMGGFFMHSREGLETEYMGDEWLECIRETVRVAKEEGMDAWLYDEDRWPSGAAGGLVPAKGGDAFRAKVITVEQLSALPEDRDDILAVFVARLDNETIQEARRVGTGEAVTLSDHETLLVFRREVSGPSEWFNDDAYADNLNPEAVKAFIDITYEAYAREVGDEFGDTVPGIFTDEPNVFAPTVRSGLPALPWTDGLVGFFHERRGYDLLDVVPWLFFEGDKATKARHDYWWTIAQRYAEAYSKQLGEWCEDHNLAFTGHYLNENELGTSIIRGGAVMPHYRYQHVPGIDMLTEQNHEFLTIKQCTSVANQFGRKRVLSETYGCSSWEFTFEGQKWVGDWQYVLGVNLRCQHLALYSIRGCRKRDYPPAFSYQATWWKYNGVVEDYFARVARVTTEGRAVRDVLLLHPVSTGWTMLGQSKDSMARTNQFGERLNTFAQALLATHYDFDFGDEIIMADSASVRGEKVVVGEAEYRVIVIPPGMCNVLASTADLLRVFLQSGGSVIIVERPPTLLDGEASADLEALWTHENVIAIPDASMLQEALESCVERRVSLRTDVGQEAARLLYMQRALDGGNAYFIVNNDPNNGFDIDLTLEGTGRLEEWDPLTGERRAIPAVSENGRLIFSSHFGPAGSRIFVVNASAEEIVPEAKPVQDVRPFRHGMDVGTYFGPSCAFTRTDPNVLTLDVCRYRLAGDEWSDAMEVWRAQDAVRQTLGMRPNYYNGLPQRYKWALEKHPSDGAALDLEFTFDVDTVPSGPVYLLLEGASQFTIRLNGRQVPSEVVGWYIDRAFHKVAIPRLHKGENVLVLSCAYTNYMEIEDCFLLGDFGVTLDRTIIAEPARLHFGDWTSQGYPHYAGSMVYHGSLEYDPTKGPVSVDLGRYEAIHVAVRVNGEIVGHVPWRSANGLDITENLRPGHNDIGIEVVSSPRNMLGPLHLAPGRQPWTDWRSFRRTDETYTPDYVLKDWGLYGQVLLRQG